MQEVTYGAAAGVMLLACATRFSLLLTLQRWIIYARAGCKVLPGGVRAGWRAMRADFPFAVDEARREG